MVAFTITLSLCFLQNISAQSVPAQTAATHSILAGGGPADDAKEPKLERFDPDLGRQDADPAMTFTNIPATSGSRPTRSLPPGLLEHRQRAGLVE